MAEEDDKKMSFLGHLEELRWRLVKAAIAVVLCAVVLFIFTEWAVDNIYMSMRFPDFPTYQMFCKMSKSMGFEDVMCATRIDIEKVISTGMTDQFSTNIFFAIVGGIVVAFPWIAYQMWGFLKPALRKNELIAARGLVFYSTLLFFLGILFGYFLVSPLAVQFFGNYKISEDTSNLFTISSYMNLITRSTFFSGILFELPVVVYILSRLSILTPEFLKKYRKHSIVVVLILAAIITPPDFISQVIVAIPILILYELSIYISRMAIRRNEAKKQQE